MITEGGPWPIWHLDGAGVDPCNGIAMYTRILYEVGELWSFQDDPLIDLEWKPMTSDRIRTCGFCGGRLGVSTYSQLRAYRRASLPDSFKALMRAAVRRSAS